MSFAVLQCDRLCVELALGAACERAPAVESELRDTLARDLPAALAPYASGHDDGQSLFIDRLVIDGAIGGRWEPEHVVRRVAERIAAAVSAQIDGGAGLRFRDRTEFVAAYLAARVDGHADSRWWFTEFAGYAPLSASNALRSVVMAERETGIAALTRLTPETARRVIGGMSCPDAARLVAFMRARPCDASLDLELLWNLASIVLPEDDRSVFECLVICERAVAGSGHRGCIDTLRLMQGLRAAALPVTFDPQSPTLREDWRAIASSWNLPLAWIDSASIELLRRMAVEIRGSNPSTEVSRIHHGRGGIFMLLDVVVVLGWADQWARSMGARRARLLAFVVAAEALAPEAAAEIVGDSRLTELLDVDEVLASLRDSARLHSRAIRSLLSPVRSRAAPGSRLCRGRLSRELCGLADRLLAELAQRIPGLAGSTSDYVRQKVLDMTAAIERGATEISVELGPAPLDVLLTLAGRKRRVFELPGGLIIRLRQGAGS